MFNETEISCYQRPSSGHKMHQIRFRQGLRPGPRWGSSRRSPRPPSRLGRGDTLPIPITLGALGAYGASILTSSGFVSAPWAPRFQFQRSATSFFHSLSTEGKGGEGREEGDVGGPRDILSRGPRVPSYATAGIVSKRLNLS